MPDRIQGVRLPSGQFRTDIRRGRKTTAMARNIIDLICNSCSCGKEEAQEYLDDEIRNLQELQADNDLRSEDFEIACSNLGLDQDWQIYFINRLAGL